MHGRAGLSVFSSRPASACLFRATLDPSLFPRARPPLHTWHRYNAALQLRRLLIAPAADSLQGRRLDHATDVSNWDESSLND